MEASSIWKPSASVISEANISTVMSALGIHDVPSFHRWSVSHYEEFWQRTIQQLGIIFKTPPKQLCDLSSGYASPKWLNAAKMNIVDSCFRADPQATAIIYQDGDQLKKIRFAELEQLTNRIANSLLRSGFQRGDAIAIIMQMSPIAVASYLAIIKMGAVVVSIADSFSSQEIATRLRIANAKGVITQYTIQWGNKQIPLYDKIVEASTPRCIVIADQNAKLRTNDQAWDIFLDTNSEFTSISCDPMSACNILFSSGTTGDPKAIPWNHTTPIKTASDAFYHQNIKAGDVLAWPTNLGWMMGPWLIFAAFINRAAIALYTGAPKDRAFGEFIQNANVTMLGVVPTLVGYWRQTNCMEGLNWQQLKVFSSTGECSNPSDMAYLMQLAGNKPIIEYCGGTEIGGAYVSSTVIQDNYPSLFSTPTMGTDFVILDEEGHPSYMGEVALIPPILGLSTQLLNADHHKVYFAGMPIMENGARLRRHGDQIELLPNGYYRLLGRVDDTMNLGGIKISAAEIERAIAASVVGVSETAAIAITPSDNGPSQLVIFAATETALDKQVVQQIFQQSINKQLNPLFKIHDVVLLNELPKTASNKIMRRVLRAQY